MSLKWRQFAEGRLIGMRTTRWSYWTHWRELADYFLPRRYKWLITPNQQSRGSPINQHIIDSTGVLAARNLSSGIMTGKTSPTKPWFNLRVGHFDATQTSPISLWLAECERILRLIFHESNFYTAMAQFYYDLVIYGTAVMLIYEDYENVISCYNPCAGEYYVDIDGNYRPCILYREFTMTIGAVVDRWGLENCSRSVQTLYNQPRSGSNLTREIIIAHAIEPNDDGRDFGIPKEFKYRECYWEWGGSTSPQAGSPASPIFLETKGYHEQPHVTVRWDLVSNDPYGRSVAMDGLGDQKQLQLQTRRKAQGIDKQVNPPMVADINMKNQPASLLPGGITYVPGYGQSGKGFSSAYDTKFPLADMTEDLREVRERLNYTFYNHLFQPISQFETRSNVTAVEIDQRKSEALIMLGPVFLRVDNEGLAVIVKRVWNMSVRAGIMPEPPPELEGAGMMTVEFTSMLKAVEDALQAASIERTLSFAGNLAGIDPSAMDNIDIDFSLDKYAKLQQNDPRMIRSPDAVAQLRQQRAEAQAAQQQAAIAEQLSAGAKNLAAADMSSPNALTAALGVAPQ